MRVCSAGSANSIFQKPKEDSQSALGRGRPAGCVPPSPAAAAFLGTSCGTTLPEATFPDHLGLAHTPSLISFPTPPRVSPVEPFSFALVRDFAGPSGFARGASEPSALGCAPGLVLEPDEADGFRAAGSPAPFRAFLLPPALGAAGRAASRPPAGSLFLLPPGGLPATGTAGLATSTPFSGGLCFLRATVWLPAPCAEGCATFRPPAGGVCGLLPSGAATTTAGGIAGSKASPRCSQRLGMVVMTGGGFPGDTRLTGSSALSAATWEFCRQGRTEHLCNRRERAVPGDSQSSVPTGPLQETKHLIL